MKECIRRLFKNIDKSSREKIKFLKNSIFYSVCSEVPKCEGDFFYNKESAFDKKINREGKSIFGIS